MKIFALYNIKGGVGKTATCVNLAYLAARDGINTLLLDIDPQGSASFYFRIRSQKKFGTKKLLKGKKKIDANIKGTDYEHLDLLPSDMSYRNLDIILDNLKGSKKKLKEIINPLASEYAFIFIDCPPNITLVSENIFHAAHYLLVPIIPTTLSMLTYSKLIKFYKKHALDQARILAFFSMVEKRKKIHRDIIDDVHKVNERFLKTYIPYAADIEKMGIYRQPVLIFRPNSPASQSFIDLWNEIKTMTS